MRSILFDIEANGLLNTVTKVWCAAAYDIETKEWFTFTPETVNQLPTLLQNYDVAIGHNIVSYDFPLLKKMYGFEYKGIMFDTLIASRVLFPDIGKHGLDDWGKRVGINKPKIDDWSYYDAEKLNRCEEDVKINLKVYERIIGLINKLSIRDSRIKNISIYNWLFFERIMTQNLDKQAENGWYFDINECYRLIEWLEPQIEETQNIIIPKLPPVYANSWRKKPTVKPFKKDGSLTGSVIAHVPDDQIDNVVGEFCRIEFRAMKLNDWEFIKNYLLKLGWIPQNWNYQEDQFGKPIKVDGEKVKTSPKIPKGEEWDIVSEQANNPDLKLIAQYNKMVHRKNILKGYAENCRGDHRIPAVAITPDQVTQRCSPKIVANVPRADGKSYLGKEMRSLFQAAPGKILVGCDADSLEARITAHYLYEYDQVLSEMLISGDIHEINVEKYNKYNISDRGTAKGMLYALLYGAQVSKVMEMFRLNKSQARELYEAFWSEYVGVLKFKQDVETEYQQFGYILGIDGRPLTVRYKHACINTKIQSCGALTMKLAYCILAKKIRETDCKIIGFYHDEIDTECHPDISDTVGIMISESMTEAGKQFKLNVPITGSYKVGLSWAEIH
jgi:DNA polymerase-1